MMDYKRMTRKELIAELERHGPLSTGEETLLHELQVHQAELEAQNFELKSAQERLEEAASRYADLYDFAPVGYADLDHAGIIRRVNLTGAAMLGVERSRLVGRSFSQFIRDDASIVAFRDHLEMCRAGAKEAVAEISIGQGLRVQTSSVPGKNGNEIFYRSAFTDITVLKKAQEEKEAMHSQLLQAQKMEVIGRLAAGISHDFNNILTAIISYSDLAMMEAKSGASRSYMEEITAAAERAQNITRQLLIFSRNQPVKMQEVDLNSVVCGMMPMLNTLIGERVLIKAALAAGLPGVMADKSNMEQMVMNLVVNARDAMPRGGGEITISSESETVSAGAAGRQAGSYVVLAVKDNGAGIGACDLEHIFEPFFSTKAQGQGIGLGLSVVQNIITEHKGWIDVESAKGKGTEFRVHLPAVDSEGPAVKNKKSAVTAPAGNGERILLVEDEAFLRKSVSLVLARNGYRVFDAGSADEAMRVFEMDGGRFDLIFSDIVMKGKSGIEFVEELRQRGHTPNILFTSGYLDIESQWPVIQEGGYRLLKKPYDVLDLLKAISESLSAAKVKS